MKQSINEVRRMQKLAGLLAETVEVPTWLAGKLEDVHTKPGQGSIFAKSVSDVLKLAQDALDKEQNIDKIANSTGTLTIKSPGIGYNLVLPIEQAKKLPGAKESEVEKVEGPNKVKVPAITTTAPLTQFKTDELTVIVRPKKDESGTVIPSQYIVLSAFPGDPSIPRASEWGGKYAVIIPSGKEELKEAEGYTANDKDMELVFDNFPSVTINVDIENGIVTKVNGDVEKESIYSYDENNFATALKPFKDAGVKVDYTPWRSSGGDDYEGYFNIDASSLNNAIASKKITIKSDPEDPEDYLVLAESLHSKQHINEVRRMQKLAGIVIEAEANAEQAVKNELEDFLGDIKSAAATIKPSPKDGKIEEALLTGIYTLVVGAPGILSVLGKGADMIASALSGGAIQKTQIGKVLQKAGHELEHKYIEGIAFLLKKTYPASYEGDDVFDEKSALHDAAHGIYAALLAAGALMSGLDATNAVNVVVKGLEGGAAALKTSEVAQLAQKIAAA